MSAAKKFPIADFIAPLATKLGIIPAKGSTRMVKYPYTTAQCFGMFPWRFHYEKVWFFRYWFYGWVVTFPLISWIGRASRSPGNFERMHEAEERDHKKHHELVEERGW